MQSLDAGTYSAITNSELPAWALVERRLGAAEIADVGVAVVSALAPVEHLIQPGSTVCLGIGSRGIDRIADVVTATVTWLRQLEADVFIVPAMGSHGGATAAGQLEVLASVGVTPETAGCEIRSSMDAVEIGRVRPDVPVFLDRHALGADLVVPVNRVKPHTDFSAAIQSGLLKMIAIGLGKQRGADTLHRQGFATFHELIPAAARISLARGNIPFGLALIENAHGRLMHVEAVPADVMVEREVELLRVAREAMGRLPFRDIDVLMIDYIGKDISGLGMDSNVVGRYYQGPTGAPPAIQRIVVRGLTDETEGNAVGIGLADVVLRRAAERIDVAKTYMNVVTAKTPEGARVPLTVDTDQEAISVAIACCLRVTAATSRIVRIRDTKHLDRMYVSAAALADLEARGDWEIIEPPQPMRFDSSGMLVGELH
jgi:hypothetical protein